MVDVETHAARCQMSDSRSNSFLVDGSSVPLYRLSQVEVVTMGGGRKVKASPRGVVTYMSTSLKEDLSHLSKSLEQLSTYFLQRHAYPVRAGSV